MSVHRVSYMEMIVPNRTICSVLEAMRDCDKTKNYSYLISLVEEAQNLANRMEAAIWDLHDMDRLHKSIKELKSERRELKLEIEGLENARKEAKES